MCASSKRMKRITENILFVLAQHQVQRICFINY